MYHDNKIALFISHIYGQYQRELAEGVISKALEYGYRTEVYCSNDGEELGQYGMAEQRILRIPDFSAIDGAVFASGTYLDEGLRTQIAQTLRDRGCPTVQVEELEPEFPCVSIENSAVFRTLTEHLITVHGARRVCYLGSARRGRRFSQMRLEHVGAVMAAHGLPFTEEDVYAVDGEEDFERALAHFTAGGGKPDAVVCYNDDVAVRFAAAAFRAGYRVPEDFAVTGCDGTEEGRNMDPPLTSVTFPVRRTGEAAVSALMDHLRGRGQDKVTIQAEPIIAGSCGCASPRNASAFLYPQKLARMIDRMESYMIISMQMAAEFSQITDLDTAMDSAAKYVRRIRDCSEFYLCLYPGWDDPSEELRRLIEEPGREPEEKTDVLLKLAMRDGTRLPECSFQRSRLLPDFAERGSDAAYMVSPLFFGTRLFGYTMLAFRDNRLDYRFHYLHWLTNLTQLLQNIFEHKRLHALSSRLESMYTKDVLTGLYNRFGFINRRETLLSSVEGRYVAALMFDVDHLKAINDRFGHSAGDFALLTVSQALRRASREEDLCARFEGDEFYVLAKVDTPRQAREMLRQVGSYLDNFNKLSAKPYAVSASGGCAWEEAEGMTGEDAARLLIQAEEDMRRAKQERPATFLR